jgi:Ca2+-binding RTX toxin-like protein
MPTTASAFFNDFAGPQEVSFLVANLPNNMKFNGLVDGRGNGEHDILSGTNKNDVIFVGDGDKVAHGGGGYDVVVTNTSFKMGADIESVVLRGTGDARVMGNDHDNNIIGSKGDNVLNGAAGDDVVVGGNGRDTAIGGVGDDTLIGGAGNDSLVGGAGDDRLLGGDGNDELFGGADNDTLIGGAGHDTIVGGKGSDHLFGGEGHDTFVMQGNDSGMDKIMDLGKGDIIDLSETNTTQFSQLAFKSDGHGNTVVTMKDGSEFKIMGYDPDDITKKMFTF